MKRIFVLMISFTLIFTGISPMYAFGEDGKEDITCTFSLEGLGTVTAFGCDVLYENCEFKSAEWLLNDLTMKDFNGNEGVCALKNPVNFTGGDLISITVSRNVKDSGSVTLNIEARNESALVTKKTIKKEFDSSCQHNYVTLEGDNSKEICTLCENTRDKVISSISVKTNPTNMDYTVLKDVLNLAGGVLSVKYYDNTTKDINMSDSEIVATGFDNTKIGLNVVTLQYKEKTTSLNINIVDKSLDHIAVTTLPNKTSYLEEKELLDLTGGKVTKYYNNDTSEVVDLEESMVSGFDNTEAGKNIVTVSINDKTCTFEVTILKKSVVSIEIVNKPSRLVYLQGETELNTLGGQVKICYDNDTNEVVDILTSMVSGFSTENIGNCELTVTIEGKDAKYTIEIIENKISAYEYETKTIEDETYVVLKRYKGIGQTTVIIPSEINGYPVKEISDSCFKDNTSFTTVYIPNSIEKLDQFAFEGCTNLEKVTLTENIKEIGGYVFYNCSKLKTAGPIGSGTNIEVGMVDEIPAYAFLGCNSLENIIIPDSVTRIGKNAFVNCTSLTNLSIPFVGETETTNTFLGYYFAGLTYKDNSMVPSTLRNIVISNSTKIGANAFNGCNSIETIKVPDTVTSIGSNAFNCSGKLIVCPGSYVDKHFAQSRLQYVEYDCYIKQYPTKTTYIQGEMLDISDGIITFMYDNKEVNSEFNLMYIKEFPTTLGEHTIVYSYDGHEFSYKINIVEKVLDRIEITTKPTKLNYLEGKDSLDVTGGKVTKYYNGNSITEVIDLSSSMVSGFDNTKVGTNTLTVTVDEKTTTFDVTIVPKTVTDIVVTTSPSITYYFEGESFDKTGMVVTAYYDNDTSEVVTDYIVSGKMKKGVSNITITYKGKSTVIEVYVGEAIVTSMKLKKMPTKTTYLEGDHDIDLSGGVVTLVYSNGKEIDNQLDKSYLTNSDHDLSKVGKQTIVLRYSDSIKCSYEINVKAKSLVSIAVGTRPKKTEYIRYQENLELFGASIVATYDNGTTDSIDITSSMVSGFDNTKLGEEIITVKWKDKVTSFVVTIIELFKRGDFTKDDKITDKDAVYLLYHTLFPNDYPIEQSGDINLDGKVTDKDAVYLLYHTLFPNDYPLN